MNRDDLFIVIPSRIGSTRLKNKPLVNIKGKTLIQRVVINALEITDNVYVATDSVLVKDNLKEITNNVVITKPEHISGTDRVYEAAKKLNLNENSFILNLQGDEPFIPSELVKKTIDDFFDNPCDVITVSNNISSDFDITNPNCVLVETDNSYAKSFIRTGKIKNPKRHIGIYGYSLKILSKLVNLEPTKNELEFKLEQLRFLENNFSIYVSHYEGHIPHGIDTEDDLNAAINYLND
tara:strand:- start:1078 stop:1788 length:711 start_codon:yes stop_codon:yes gene_type:complete